jgi:hypothetical protein
MPILVPPRRERGATGSSSRRSARHVTAKVFFVLQPGLGAGSAASKKNSEPNVARLRSLITRSVFGPGLEGPSLAVAMLVC